MTAAYVAIVCLSILALSALGALILREMTHDRERRELTDRIVAPSHSQAAAAERLLPPPPAPTPEPDMDVRPTDSDLLLLESLT